MIRCHHLALLPDLGDRRVGALIPFQLHDDHRPLRALRQRQIELGAEQERAAALVQKVHDDFISSIEYNDENSLSCTVMIALLASFATR